MKYIKLFEAFNILIAYHGTPNGGFSKFDISKRGEGADQDGFGDYGNGFYFTTSKSSAIAYAKGLTKERIGNKPYVYTVNLKINNPFNLDMLYDYDKNVTLKINANNKSNKPKPKDSILNITDDEIAEIQNKMGLTDEIIDFMRDVESDIGDNWGDWDIASKLKENGFDAIMVKIDSKHSNEIVVFDEEQIQIIKKEQIM